MGFHGFPWVPMGSHGSPWVPMGPMGPHGTPWYPMGPHGTPWDPIGPHGTPLDPIGPHLKYRIGDLSDAEYLRKHMESNRGRSPVLSVFSNCVSTLEIKHCIFMVSIKFGDHRQSVPQ